VLFSSLGSGRTGALLNAVIIGAVHVAATFFAILCVDRLGRRWVLLGGGALMFVGMVRLLGLTSMAV
jgi:hypothetical protein